MKLVLDASMALAWLFERQKKEEVICADRVLVAIANHETLVPSLWHIAVINALLVGERRKVVTEAQVIDYQNKLSMLPITTDSVTIDSRSDIVMALAREHELTAYDAIYLDLALRIDATLATFDKKLTEAMHRAGGKIFS